MKKNDPDIAMQWVLHEAGLMPYLDPQRVAIITLTYSLRSRLCCSLQPHGLVSTGQPTANKFVSKEQVPTAWPLIDRL